jgi:hypothetical protein
MNRKIYLEMYSYLKELQGCGKLVQDRFRLNLLLTVKNFRFHWSIAMIELT